MKCSVLRKNLPKHLAANVFIALCNRSGRNACITNIWKCFIYQVKTYINNAVINMPKWSMQRQLLKASETNDRLGEDWKKIFLEHFHKMSIFSQCRQSPAWSRHIYYNWKCFSLETFLLLWLLIWSYSIFKKWISENEATFLSILDYDNLTAILNIASNIFRKPGDKVKHNSRVSLSFLF